jgi:hypothetical protein
VDLAGVRRLIGRHNPTSRAQSGCAGRLATAPNGGEFNDVTVSPRTRTTHMARSTCPAYLGLFIQTTDSGPVLCRALSVGDRHHTALITGLNWFLPPVEPNFCLTPSYQPASDPLRQGTDLNEVGGASLHTQQYGDEHGQEVVKGGRGVGQFSQAGT